MDKWIALYLPDTKYKISREFLSEKEAWDYIESQNCNLCKKEGLKSSCAAEWTVIKSKDYKKCKTFMDIMLASGHKILYKRPGFKEPE